MDFKENLTSHRIWGPWVKDRSQKINYKMSLSGSVSNVNVGGGGGGGDVGGVYYCVKCRCKSRNTVQ